VIGGLLTGLSGLGFHLHHRGTAVGLVFQLSTFNRYPMDLFPKVLRYLLTFVLPLGFAGFYPASFLLGRDEWLPYAVATPFVGALCLGGGWWFWGWSLRRYSSGGG
jgi:ABC-2 type transport system permease protein